MSVRRHVEGGVADAHARGWRIRARDLPHLRRGPLFYGNGIAGGDGEVEGGGRGRDVERHAVINKPTGKEWGDYVADAAGGVFTPPNGILNVDDLSALLAFFQGRTVSDPEYVVTTLELVDETTTFVISASDLQAWLGAFGGGTYPPASFPTQGGPKDCP